MSKLSMTNKNVGVGEFVKTLRGTTGVGFAEGFHVHKDWMARTIDFDAALAVVDKAESERKDYTIEANKLNFTVDNAGKFVVEIDGKQYRPSDHSFPQLSTKIGVKSASILREMDATADHDDSATMVAIAKNSMRHLALDRKFFIRTYADGTLRAWFTDKYAPVDNRWFLETLREFLPNARLSHWQSTEDTLWGNLLIPDSMKRVNDGDDTDFGCMLSVSNCEIGIRRINTLPSLFRSICLNGCIWGAVQGQGIRKKHMGEIKLDDLKLSIANAIATQLPIAAAGIDQFLATRNLKTQAPLANIVAMIAAEQKFKESEALRILDAWELLESSNENLYGLVNSVTRAGQSFGNAQRWYDFDVVGGSLASMSPNNWERINAKAKNATTEDIVSAFGVAV